MAEMLSNIDIDQAIGALAGMGSELRAGSRAALLQALVTAEIAGARGTLVIRIPADTRAPFDMTWTCGAVKVELES